MRSTSTCSGKNRLLGRVAAPASGAGGRSGRRYTRRLATQQPSHPSTVPPHMMPLAAAAILLWARWRRKPWSDLGFVRPTSWPRSIALGIVSGAALKLFLKIVVMPLLGANPINVAYHFLAHNPAAVPGM